MTTVIGWAAAGWGVESCFTRFVLTEICNDDRYATLYHIPKGQNQIGHVTTVSEDPGMRKWFIVAALAGATWSASVLGDNDDGFKPLFNGKDMTGWTYVGNGSAWSVENGMLTCRGGYHGWVCTEKMYDNFVLRLEYRISEGGNSGVFVRIPQRFGRSSRLGFETQILDDYGKAPTKSTTGSLYDMVAPTKNMSKPAGEWNSYEIHCDGPMIKIVHNGETVVDVNADEIPKVRNRFRRGHIGIQNHGRFVEFRNIRIKQLPSAFDD